MLRFHPDGWVWIDGFQATKQELEAVVGTLDLPDGIAAEYDGRTSTRLVRGDQFAGPLPWLQAESILANAVHVIEEIRRRRQVDADIKAAEIQEAERRRRDALTSDERALEDLNRLPSASALAFALAVQLDANFARQSPEVQAAVNRIVRQATDAALAVFNQ